MVLMFCLNRADDGAVPNWPAAFTLTAMPDTPAPLMPATNVFVWNAPIRIVLDSPPTPKLPISILLLPVVRLAPAPLPRAMLLVPLVLRLRAPSPTAVLTLPTVLPASAVAPTAVFAFPVWLL